MIFLGHVIHFNCISLHYFYRDRLNEAYLQTELRVKPKHDAEGQLALVRDDSGLYLTDLHDRYVEKSNQRNPAPYHLILTALNLPGSRDLARKDRKSDHFVFSKLFCGSTTTGYVPTTKYWNGKTKLSIAMTISGAAASSSMGFHTSFSQSFAMTLFNIRLGFWADNPSLSDHVVHTCSNASDGQQLVKSNESHKTRGHIGGFLDHIFDRVTFWPRYLFHELTAWTNARHRLINLSDGGHTGDNIGLYPLLQRRCRLIIACDGECDPDYSFRSLSAAIRQIYTDENVGIDIDIKQIQPDASENLPQEHFMLGKITYPTKKHNESKLHQFTDDPNSNWAIGYIIYLKATFTNTDEAATVQSYAARNPDFPHQTTADQFFDDDQFESYRALGATVVKSALTDAFGTASIETISPDLIVKTLISWCAKQFGDGFYRAQGGKTYHTAACQHWNHKMEFLMPAETKTLKSCSVCNSHES